MAYNFVAANVQHLEVADNSALDITGAITLSAWFKSTGTYSANKGIVGKFQASSNQRSYVLYLDASGKVGFVVSANGTFQANGSLLGTTTAGTNWRQVAGVLDPSVRQELFLDGTSEALTNSSVAASIYNSTAALHIGRQSGAASNNTFDGDIAEVGIWDVALTTAEIASLADGFACDKVRPQSLVFYAPLIRELQDVRGGLSIANINVATVANHPRVYA